MHINFPVDSRYSLHEITERVQYFMVYGQAAVNNALEVVILGASKA